MGWYAKPSGAIGYNTDEGRANIQEMCNFFNERGYSIESQAGIIGNSVAEGGLNPWRWQGDKYNQSLGYGLFQYTPASDYINGCTHIQYHAPNLSVTEVTDGASPTDAIAQMIVFDQNTLYKWGSGCWRPYWDKDTYADLYDVRNRLLELYGNGSSLTMQQFKAIDNVYYATFAFLACFEGPTAPSMDIRYEYASDIYKILTGENPDDPVIPPDNPITPNPKRKKLPIWMMVRPF